MHLKRQIKLLPQRPLSIRQIGEFAVFIIVLLVFLGGAVLYLRLFAPLQTIPDQALFSLNAYLQRFASDEKVPDYKVMSARKSSNTTSSGESWCIIITPPVSISKADTVDHFFALDKGSMSYAILPYDVQSQSIWLAQGCGDWYPLR